MDSGIGLIHLNGGRSCVNETATSVFGIDFELSSGGHISENRRTQLFPESGRCYLSEYIFCEIAFAEYRITSPETMAEKAV
ncbi:MAG: hypothetical protein D6761_09525 [Candidatus Dadabacteria bacterium]|nr:MAG: hypothetical protein D6761_09525 [Candidatus Dadabacteria bacterium]